MCDECPAVNDGKRLEDHGFDSPRSVFISSPLFFFHSSLFLFLPSSLFLFFFLSFTFIFFPPLLFMLSLPLKFCDNILIKLLIEPSQDGYTPCRTHAVSHRMDKSIADLCKLHTKLYSIALNTKHVFLAYNSAIIGAIPPLITNHVAYTGRKSKFPVV